MTKGHMVQYPAITPHFFFFLFKNDTHNYVGQPIGTSSKEVKICALEGFPFVFTHLPLYVHVQSLTLVNFCLTA